MTDGFICKYSAGRVVRLIHNYDSEAYPDEPEKLAAQWGSVWNQNPDKAKPFIALATSPYMNGDCYSVVKPVIAISIAAQTRQEARKPLKSTVPIWIITFTPLWNIHRWLVLVEM